jgi:hypothetical protein
VGNICNVGTLDKGMTHIPCGTRWNKWRFHHTYYSEWCTIYHLQTAISEIFPFNILNHSWLGSWHTDDWSCRKQNQWYTDDTQKFLGVGVLGLFWNWKQRRTPAAEVRKILFVEKRSESLHGGMHQDLENGGPMSQVGNWVFIAFFIAWGWRCLSGANRYLLGRRSVSCLPG